jgi:hypothetical protein
LEALQRGGEGADAVVADLVVAAARRAGLGRGISEGGGRCRPPRSCVRARCFPDMYRGEGGKSGGREEVEEEEGVVSTEEGRVERSDAGRE